jgi:hypothetical protein
VITARCRSCRARIIWCHTDTGKRIPVDATANVAGNLRLDDGDSPPRAHVVGSTIDLFDPTDDGVRYLPHWASWQR